MRSNCTSKRTTYACHVYSALDPPMCMCLDHLGVHQTSILLALPALIDSGDSDLAPDCFAISLLLLFSHASLRVTGIDRLG